MMKKMIPLRISTLSSALFTCAIALSIAAQAPPHPAADPASIPPGAPAATPPKRPDSPTRPAQPEQAPSTQPALPKTVNAVPRAEQWWIERHNNLLRMKMTAPWDMIFLGDSITQGWEQTGASVWDKHFAHRKALNLGFSGDRTQHALWRVEFKEVEDYNPKLAVVMIGTNNSNGQDNTAEEIALGIKAVIEKLRVKQPTMKILLLAIFPRGETPNAQREKNAKASELASAIADGKMIHYLDIGAKFMDDKGVISKDVMPDFLHLSEKGYQIWADAIEAKVAELMEEGAAKRVPTTPAK